MATISNTLRLQDAMSSVLQRIQRNSSEVESTFGKVGKSLNTMSNGMNSAKVSASSFLSSLLKFGAIQKIFGMITNQLNSAISRFDTLNNYTKVMANLGVSEEAANKSRERLSTGLKGLPTTLDAAALSVQKFTSANGDVEASTEMFLALNNALLAGGASTEIQASALEQMSQAYAKGKPDMMEWRALQQAMPGQLNQIAKAMKKTTVELGNDLRSGKVSMNDFMKTVVQLNQEGIDGFDNFEKQAKNATGGIGTAIANMKSAITRGWVEMISGANNALEASGLPTLQEIIVNLGNNIEEMMTRLGQEVIPQFAKSLQIVSDSINRIDNDTSNALSNSLNLMDYFTVGLSMLAAGVSVLIGGIQVDLLALQLGFETLVLGGLGAFYGLQTGVEAVMVGIASAAELAVNAMIAKFNALIDAFNTVFAVFNVSIQKISEVTFAEDFATSVGNNAIERQNKLKDYTKNIDATQAKMDALISKNNEDWTNAGMNILDTYNGLAGGKQSRGAGSVGGGSSKYNPSNIDKLMNGVTGTDGKGGKAIKTTSNDRLLKDEDIQLLLDVATRDYQLNYQQMTPNVSVTFGDVRETADVNSVMDAVGTAIDELINGDAEVKA